MDRPAWFRFGKLTRPHGVRGELRLVPHQADDELPPALQRLRVAADASILDVLTVRRTNDAYLVRIAGIDNREAADRLRNTDVEVAIADLPALEEGEFYFMELIGLTAVDEEGVELGRVAGFPDRPGQTLMALQTPSGELLVPVVDGVVAELDREGRRVVIAVPEGLWD